MVGLLAFYLVVSVAFCSPLFAQPLALGVNDWDQHLFYYGSVLKNVVEYGQMPFWNPWYCAGNVMWQNPQIAILSPVYPLAMVMPLQLAMKLNIVLHYWIGFVGAHLLMTQATGLMLQPLVVLLATIVTAAGATAIHLTAGHSVFLPGLYLPLLLYFLLRAIDGGQRGNVLIAERAPGTDGVQRRRSHSADGGRRNRDLRDCSPRCSRARGGRCSSRSRSSSMGFAYAAPKLLAGFAVCDRRYLLGHAKRDRASRSDDDRDAHATRISIRISTPGCRSSCSATGGRSTATTSARWRCCSSRSASSSRS